MAERDHRPKGRVVGDTKDQLARLRPYDHRLHDHARQPRARPHFLGALQDVGGRGAHRIDTGEIEHHAADVRFVRNVMRQHFHHHGMAVGE